MGVTCLSSTFKLLDIGLAGFELTFHLHQGTMLDIDLRTGGAVSVAVAILHLTS